jgi:GntR family transcriptional repressor for pyruvate dehydrogenase complex
MARKHRDVMRVLTADIVSGERPAGEMVPREVDLAEAFDVSRGVTRETIRAMEECGLISVKHGKGATINEPSEWDVFDPDVLAAMLETERGSEVLAEYLECRRILEVEAAGIAAERAGKRDIASLEAAMARMEQTAARPHNQLAEERFHEADIAFHQALIAARATARSAGWSSASTPRCCWRASRSPAPTTARRSRCSSTGASSRRSPTATGRARARR